MGVLAQTLLRRVMPTFSSILTTKEFASEPKIFLCRDKVSIIWFSTVNDGFRLDIDSENHTHFVASDV